MPAKKDSISFEEQLKHLEQIVQQLEQGNLPLEESLSAFEQGIKLSRTCHEKLTKAEQKVKILVEKNGLETLVDFEEK